MNVTDILLDIVVVLLAAKLAAEVAERIHVPVVMLPFSVGGTPAAKDLFGLFDDTVARLVAAGAKP